MSIFEQTQEEYDLFSMELFEDATEPSSAQNVAVTVPTIFAKPESFKHFSQAKEMYTKRLTEKVAILKTLAPGTLLLRDGYMDYMRYELTSSQEDKIYGKIQHLTSSEEPKTYATGENTISEELEVNEIIGAIIEGKFYFFTKDLFEPISLKSEEHFVNYVKRLSAEQTEELLVYAIYFKSPIRENLKRNQIYRTEYFKRMGSLGGFDDERYIGHRRFQLCGARNRRAHYTSEKEWVFDFFGAEISYSTEEMHAMYDRFIERMQINVLQGLSTLSDCQIIAYYKIQGVNVYKDFITEEWSYQVPNSSKKMYVTREALSDPTEVEQTWVKFSTVKKPTMKKSSISRFPMMKDSYMKKYGQPWELKRYDLSSKVKIELRGKYAELTQHKTYQVISDDGLYVHLQPIDQHNNELITDKPIVKYPRKNVTFGRIDIPFVNDKGENDFRIKYMNFPYAIPRDMGDSIEELSEQMKLYADNLSELEIKQFLALEYAMRKSCFRQTMVEKDYEAAIKILSDTGTGGGTGTYIEGVWMNHSGGKISYSKGYNSGKLIEMSGKQVFNMYFEMETAVNTLTPDKLTLPELTLKYYLDYGVSLRTYGIPGHFTLDGEILHTSKYAIENVEETYKRVFCK